MGSWPRTRSSGSCGRSTATSGAKPSSAPVAKPAAEVARADDGKPGGRVAFAVGAAAVTGIGAWVFGVFTPWTDALDMGFAAAVGRLPHGAGGWPSALVLVLASSASMIAPQSSATKHR